MDTKTIECFTYLLSNGHISCLAEETYHDLLENAIEHDNSDLMKYLQNCAIDHMDTKEEAFTASYLIQLCRDLINKKAKTEFIQIVKILSYGEQGEKIAELILEHKWEEHETEDFWDNAPWPYLLYNLCASGEDDVYLSLEVYNLIPPKLQKQIIHKKGLLKQLIYRGQIHKIRHLYLDIYNLHKEKTPTYIVQELYKPETGELWKNK